uniref:Geranylgeranyl pyrophosphate synthase n=1 Tax=Plectus sambesii TaxID=2011161 RepID=A0A914UKW5_9BILA
MASATNGCCSKGSDGREEMSADEIERVLLAPYAYICQMPGKHIRSKLATAFNIWLNVPKDKLMLISEIVQMLHNASLMIDDIEDSSILRRGLPVSHSIYGIPQTINAANYVYFLALQKCFELGHPDATSIFTEQLLELHRGQGKELYWRDTLTCPSRKDYEEMVMQKTGGLFGLAVRLMQLFSANKGNFKPLIDTLGLLFQIRDDYASLCSADYAEKKSYAEDLTEGKFSFPIIHAIQNDSTDGQVISE